MKKHYTLGNALRGAFSGDFASQEMAFKWLSRRFFLSWPSENGRFVSMQIEEKNSYGIMQMITCFEGTHHMDDKPVSRTQIMRLTRRGTL